MDAWRPTRPQRAVEVVKEIDVGAGSSSVEQPQPAASAAVTASVADTPADPPLAPHPSLPTVTLTAVRAHYLKKSLIQLQLNREIDALLAERPSNVSSLSYLGSPFTRPPRDDPAPLDIPILRYVFRQFILTFPFLASAPKEFFPDKVQPFVASLLSRSIFTPSSILEDDDASSDQAASNKLLAKAGRSSALLVNYALKIAEPEQVVRLTQQDLDRLEALARKRHARLLKRSSGFDVNVVSVRLVSERGRVRTRSHEEFIIRLRRPRYEDVFVSRRYGDFRTLADELRKHHPEELIKPPPTKDRTYVNAPASAFGAVASFSGSSDSLPPSPASPINPASRLAREKNRLTLRAYLHSLLTIPSIASSPVLYSFLISNPTTLNASELDDARRREEADRQRDEGRKHFEREVASRVDSLRASLKELKGDILGKDGLTQMFAILKQTEDVRNLPREYQKVLEWGRISFASTIFHHYVASDDASQNIAGLKRIHGLMPYFLLKSALKISNPVGMIRTVLDLFTAQPFGGRSLLQRMFTSSLHEDVRVIESDIQIVKDKVDDPMICEKVRLFVYAPRDVQNIYKADADEEKVNILTAILRSAEEPVLSRAQMHRVFRAHRAHAEYITRRESLEDSDDDEGPQDEDAWMFEDLALLAKLYSKLRDKEQLIELIFEGNTADLLKDIITIFYAPLAQIYRAANIADSIGDLQAFISDLIRTVESAEELSTEDPRRTVQVFIDLIQRHEQSFYSFVHKVHAKGEGLFNGLMRWLELFLTVSREGFGDPRSLEFLLPHTDEERVKILSEVDAVALYHYKLKVAYETKLRRRFGGAAGGSGRAEDEAAQAIVNGLMQDFGSGDIMKEDAQEAAQEDSDDSGSWDSDDGDETDSSGSYETDTSDERQTRTATTIARSRTMPAPPTPSPLRPSTTVQRAPQTPTDAKSTQQRLLSFPSTGSLRRVRSLTLSDATSRSSSSGTPPPVPPLPGRLTNVNKSLPRDPVEKLHPPPPPPKAEQTSRPLKPSSPTRKSQSHSRPRQEAGKVKNQNPAPTEKLPELHHIPELLPLFVEILRPQLITRSI